ncbi:MAG: DUF4249 family protein [Bacteroidales bacterium]|nr:DUF4249 family protein [Bacteroidales bacterium]
MNLRCFTYIILLLTLFACELERDLDIPLPTGEKYYTLEAYLVHNEPYQTLLFRSNTMQGPVVFDLVWNASVKIINNTDTIRLSNIIQTDNTNNYIYNYYNDKLVDRNTAGYELSIITKTSDTLSAFSLSVPEVEIDSFRVMNNLLSVFTNNTNLPGSNYYMIRYYTYPLGENVHQQKVFDYSEKPEGLVQIDFPLSSDSIDSLYVNLYRINQTAFNYHISIEKAYAANHDPFTIPGPIQGNIKNGFGIFTCCSLDTCMIYLP